MLSTQVTCQFPFFQFSVLSFLFSIWKKKGKRVVLSKVILGVNHSSISIDELASITSCDSVHCSQELRFFSFLKFFLVPYQIVKFIISSISKTSLSIHAYYIYIFKSFHKCMLSLALHAYIYIYIHRINIPVFRFGSHGSRNFFHLSFA